MYVFRSDDAASWTSEWPAPPACAQWTDTAGPNGIGDPDGVVQAGEWTYPGYFAAEENAAAVLVPGPFAPGETVTLKQYFGWSLTRCADFDGDGTKDFAIGAPGPDNRSGPLADTPAFSGRVYVVSGSKLATAIAGLTGSNKEIDASTVLCDGFDFTTSQDDGTLGASPGDRVGFSLGWSKDLNDDGSCDLVVGSPQHRWEFWDDDVTRYAVDCTGPGSVSVLYGYPSGSPASAVPYRSSVTGIWYLSGYATGPQAVKSPSYGEAFGYSVHGRIQESPRPGGTGDPQTWDVVVGSPLWSETPLDELGAVDVTTFSVAGEGDVEFPNWGDSSALLGSGEPRSLGRATLWTWPDGSASAAQAPPTTGWQWQMQGQDTLELVGYTVRGVGDLSGTGIEEVAVCARGFCINPRLCPPSACSAPCYQEIGQDDQAGGPLTGAVTVHSSLDGLVLYEVRGEDPRTRSAGEWGGSRATPRTTRPGWWSPRRAGPGTTRRPWIPSSTRTAGCTSSRTRP